MRPRLRHCAARGSARRGCASAVDSGERLIEPHALELERRVFFRRPTIRLLGLRAVGAQCLLEVACTAHQRHGDHRKLQIGGRAHRVAGQYSETSGIVAWHRRTANYELSFWRNNLNNAYNINSGFMDSTWQFDFAGVDAPREAGATMKMRF